MSIISDSDIVNRITELVYQINPEVSFRKKYGGIVFELSKNDHHSLIGGIYRYARHASLELSNGSALIDPGGVLEGTGKFRRHVKLTSVEEIESKGCPALLMQAMLQAAIYIDSEPHSKTDQP